MAGIASSRDIYLPSVAEIVPGAKGGSTPAERGGGGRRFLFGPLNARPRRTWKKIQLVVPRRRHHPPPASLHAKGKAKSQNEEDARACTHARMMLARIGRHARKSACARRPGTGIGCLDNIEVLPSLLILAAVCVQGEANAHDILATSVTPENSGVAPHEAIKRSRQSRHH